MRGKVIKVNLARPMKGPAQLGGNRAGASRRIYHFCHLFNPSLSQSGSQRNGYNTI